VPSWGTPVSGDPKVFDGANHYIGDVQATIDFGFDGIKLDGCGEFRNLSFFAQEFNKTGVPVMMENCHWGGDGPDDGCSCFPCVLSAFLTFQQVGMAAPFTSSELQVISISTGTGIILVLSCAFLAVCYSLFSLRPDTPSLYGIKLHVQSSDCREVATLERCRQNWTWLLGVPPPPPLLPSHLRGFRKLLFHVSTRYPDMLEVGFLANDAEDRTHFSAWCIVSSPLVLGHNISDQVQTSKIWPIITKTQAIDVNQKFAGHPGGLVTSWNIGHDNVSDASTGRKKKNDVCCVLF
jgi:hypothetical protein